MFCEKLDREVYSTEQFKKAAADFILVKIDILKTPEVAEPYNVSGVPDIRFLRPDGTEVHKFVGYQPLQGVLNDMATALSKK